MVGEAHRGAWRWPELRARAGTHAWLLRARPRAREPRSPRVYVGGIRRRGPLHVPRFFFERRARLAGRRALRGGLEAHEARRASRIWRAPASDRSQLRRTARSRVPRRAARFAGSRRAIARIARS